MSRAALARLLGRSREEVQRWATGREQIPRAHLIEVVLQIASPQDLDYVLRLKDCEDVSDRIDRSLRDIARLTRTDLESMGAASRHAIMGGITHGFPPPDLNSASAYFRLLADAAYALRLWNDYILDSAGSPLIDESNIRRHVRNPLNRIMASTINLSRRPDRASGSERLEESRERALADLLRLAAKPHQSEAGNFTRQHSIHLYLLISEFGDSSGTLDSIMADASQSSDPLMRRLGHASLIIEGADAEAPSRYLSLLRDDVNAVAVDLAFEAVHYGDTSLDAEGNMPLKVSEPIELIKKLIARIKDRNRPESVREIDVFRLLRAVECGLVSQVLLRDQVAQADGFAEMLAQYSTGEAIRLRGLVLDG